MAALEVMLMLPPLHLLINQEARQAANRLRNGCSYGPKFWHSDVFIGITDETPLLLSPRDNFVTLNLFDRKFSVDFPTKERIGLRSVLIWLHWKCSSAVRSLE
jgi:hypothetical protein